MCVMWAESEPVYGCGVCRSVVTLRQLERQLDHERDTMKIELTTAEVVHQDEVTRLTKQLQTLQSDNNLLMVSQLAADTTCLAYSLTNVW